MLSMLLWIFLFALILVGVLLAMGKMMQFQTQEEESRKFSRRASASRIFIWVASAIVWVPLAEPLFAKVGVLILGVSLAVVIEIVQFKSFNKRNQAPKETEW